MFGIFVKEQITVNIKEIASSDILKIKETQLTQRK